MLEDYSYSREILEEYEHINEILNDIKRQFDVMIEHHCKVLLVHFVLRFPAGTFHQRNNEEISEFVKKLTNYYEYRRVATCYIWGREQLTSCAPHYHVALLLDGSQRHHTPTIWDEAAEIWSRITNGPHALLHRCWHAPHPTWNDRKKNHFFRLLSLGQYNDGMERGPLPRSRAGNTIRIRKEHPKHLQDMLYLISLTGSLCWLTWCDSTASPA